MLRGATIQLSVTSLPLYICHKTRSTVFAINPAKIMSVDGKNTNTIKVVFVYVISGTNKVYPKNNGGNPA
jgi:hypothetical protein